MATSCYDDKKNVELTKSNLTKRAPDLKHAEADNENEFKKFISAKKLEILQNEKSLQDFQLKIANQKKDVREDYEKQITTLNLKSTDLKKQLAEIEYTNKDDWKSFEISIVNQMEELGKAIKVFTTTKKDEGK